MKLLRFLILLSVFVGASTSCWSDPLAGAWKGIVNGANLHLIVHVSGVSGSYSATTDSTDQGASGISTTIAISGNTVTIDLQTPSPFVYTGTLSGNVITGTWSQGGHTGPMILLRQLPSSAGHPNAAFAGLWSGVVEGPNLHLVVHISTIGIGYSATTDSVDQNANGIATTIVLNGDAVNIVLGTGSPFTYTGTLAGNTVTGIWSQGGGTGAMTLTKSGG